MPIPNTVLTAAQFEFLANNVTSQLENVSTTGAIALSGLNYLIDLDIDAPEVDLVNPLYDQMTRMDAFGSTYSNWTAVATALNLHGINRGTAVSGTLSDRLNLYFDDESIVVPYVYAQISAAAGFVIQYLYITTTIASVTPATGSTAGGESVTIVGENFITSTVAPPGTVVSFGGSSATDVVVVSGTEITCKTPAHGGGAVNVVVTNPAGIVSGATLTNGFTYS